MGAVCAGVLCAGDLQEGAAVRRAQVLVWSDLLEENHWVDVATKARTEGGLVKHLRAMVAAGEALAWRIIRIEREEMGAA